MSKKGILLLSLIFSFTTLAESMVCNYKHGSVSILSDDDHTWIEVERGAKQTLYKSSKIKVYSHAGKVSSLSFGSYKIHTEENKITVAGKSYELNCPEVDELSVDTAQIISNHTSSFIASNSTKKVLNQSAKLKENFFSEALNDASRAPASVDSTDKNE